MTGLPERLVLVAHHGVVATGPRARRIGTGPGARVLDDLSPAAVAALDRLGAGPCRTPDLLACAPPGPDRRALGALLAVLCRDGLVTGTARGARVLRNRGTVLVEVRGDSPLAVLIVLGLSGTGTGHVHPRVDGPVRPGDGLAADDAGRDRAAVLCGLLAAAGVRSGPPGRVPPDLVVLAGRPEPGPATEHLAVTLRDGRGVVGPLVLPGRSPCLRCHAGPATAATIAAAGPRTAEPHTVAATAALAVGQVLAAVDGPVHGAPPPASLAAELELDADTATITRRPVRGRPGCPCGARADSPAACGPGAVGWTIEE